MQQLILAIIAFAMGTIVGILYMDAVDRMILSHTVTQDDVDDNFLTIAEPVMTVTRVIWGGSGLTSGDFASALWQTQAALFGGLGFTGNGGCSSSSPLTDYAISMQNISNVSNITSNMPTVQYSMHSNR